MKKSFTKIIAGVTLAGSLFAIPAFAAGGNGAGTGNGNAARQEQVKVMLQLFPRLKLLIHYPI